MEEASFTDSRSRVGSNVFGSLTVLTLVGTFILDVGLPDGIAAWAPYSIAVVLALLWGGARTIVFVTAAALVLTLIGLWIGRLGDFETGVVNRSIGTVTITCLGLACLYVERSRQQLLQSHDERAAGEHQLLSFVDDMHNMGIVLLDLRGRVTEWNHGAQLLTGYQFDDIKGRPLYRIFPGKTNSVARWGQVCHQARHEKRVVRQEVFQRRDGSWCLMHMVVKPLLNRLRRHHGYSLVMQALTNPSSMTKGSSSKDQPIRSLAIGKGDIVSYRCRFEPRRALDHIRPINDATGTFQSVQRLSDLVHPLDRERVWTTIRETVSARRPYAVVYRLANGRGRDTWVWDEGEAVTGDDGIVTGLKGVLTHI